MGIALDPVECHVEVLVLQRERFAPRAERTGRIRIDRHRTLRRVMPKDATDQCAEYRRLRITDRAGMDDEQTAACAHVVQKGLLRLVRHPLGRVGGGDVVGLCEQDNRVRGYLRRGPGVRILDKIEAESVISQQGQARPRRSRRMPIVATKYEYVQKNTDRDREASIYTA